MERQTRPYDTFYWVDVRDVALAHAKALEAPGADGPRFLLTEGPFDNSQIASAAIKRFPELKDKFPEKLDSDMPAKLYECDTAPSREILGIKYLPINEMTVDAIESLQAFGLRATIRTLSKTRF